MVQGSTVRKGLHPGFAKFYQALLQSNWLKVNNLPRFCNPSFLAVDCVHMARIGFSHSHIAMWDNARINIYWLYCLLAHSATM